MRAVVDSYLLTPIQQGMLFHHLQGANVGVDVEQMVGNLHEAVDVEVLRHAWQRIAGGLSPEEQEARLASFMTDDRRRGFDLAVAPMWRITLFRLGDTSQRFVFTYHHSLLDISVVWVVEEAFQTYDAALRGEVAPLEQRRPFRDHVEWLHEHLRTDRDAAQAYYRQLLAGYDEPPPSSPTTSTLTPTPTWPTSRTPVWWVARRSVRAAPSWPPARPKPRRCCAPPTPRLQSASCTRAQHHRWCS